ncbi:MAG: hypothetical protein KF817_13860 [Phycisphaeraceae bacterium]|nr:hypothetical protein [Phycisphaeraceae bacterium]
MAWSLTHHPIAERERLDRFLLAIGKSLYLAAGYEVKCRVVLRIARIAHELRNGHALPGASAICEAMRKNMLGTTLRELQRLTPSMRDASATVLERARDARNFIAHEAAWLGPLFAVTTPSLDEKLLALHDAVAALAAGDNLVSQWIYEIEEREPAPFTIRTAYPQWVEDWVFAREDGL